MFKTTTTTLPANLRSTLAILTERNARIGVAADALSYEDVLALLRRGFVTIDRDDQGYALACITDAGRKALRVSQS